LDPGRQGSSRYLFTLSLGALGVVYGDIGTSVLYALRECFHAQHGVPISNENILGILSLIFWSLTIVISVKYLVFVMRADNRGEGGILALMSLAGARGKGRAVLVALGLFGSALLYGDGMITPAISVLSAIEGVEVAAPGLKHYVVPITIVVLICLFFVQKFGTAKVGAAFGPVMCVWFAVIAAMGVPHILEEPHVLAAINPLHAFSFFLANRLHGFLVLGAVFLVVTGGEALYADMGHFGVRPIRITWFVLVLPCLLLNYFGQGAFLLRHPNAVDDPFFRMAPKWSTVPLVCLAALATVIASQAVISGAFSLTRQAVQLGYMPRIEVRHTSEREIGQIYIPSVNYLLMICAIGLVVVFRESTNLAAAYGVAVTATMGITTLLLAVVERERWKWSRATILALTIPLLFIDLGFFGANIIKVADGGWFPLAVGVLVFAGMTTWRRGRQILAERLGKQALPLDDLIRNLAAGQIHRVPGTAVFLTRYSSGVPTPLLHNIKHNKVVHQTVVLLTIDVEEMPRVPPEERCRWEDMGEGLYRLIARFGYMEDTDIPSLLQSFTDAPVKFQQMRTSYFLGRENLVATNYPGMALWRERLFAWMMRNATNAATFFSLPANQVIEVGATIEI
jgi:KUP system potassium uptake protein